MFRFLSTILDDLHPALVHFPIALLFVAFFLTVLGRTNGKYKETSWIMLVIGALATIPTAVSGFISHFPYENLPVSNDIGKHNILGFAVTIIFNLILFWRWKSRKSDKDIFDKTSYLIAFLLGIIILFFLGGSGGSLVFEDGVNVRGINPLLN